MTHKSEERQNIPFLQLDTGNPIYEVQTLKELVLSGRVTFWEVEETDPDYIMKLKRLLASGNVDVRQLVVVILEHFIDETDSVTSQTCLERMGKPVEYIPLLLDLLKPHNADASSQHAAVNILDNLSEELETSKEYVAMVVREQGIWSLVNLLGSTDLEKPWIVIHVLLSLTYNYNREVYEAIEETDCAEFLVNLLGTQPDESNDDFTALLMSRLANHSIKLAEKIVAFQGIKKLVPLLGKKEAEEAPYSVVFALDALACRSREIANEIVTAGSVPLLVAILSSDDTNIHEHVASLLANLAYYSTTNIEIGIKDAELLQLSLLKAATHGTPTQRRVLPVLRNVCTQIAFANKKEVNLSSINANLVIIKHLVNLLQQTEYRQDSTLCAGVIFMLDFLIQESDDAEVRHFLTSNTQLLEQEITKLSGKTAERYQNLMAMLTPKRACKRPEGESNLIPPTPTPVDYDGGTEGHDDQATLPHKTRSCEPFAKRPRR